MLRTGCITLDGGSQNIEVDAGLTLLKSSMHNNSPGDTGSYSINFYGTTPYTPERLLSHSWISQEVLQRQTMPG